MPSSPSISGGKNGSPHRQAKPRTGLWLCIITVVLGLVQRTASAQDEGQIAKASAAEAARLPAGAAKALVLQHCNICHDLAWIERSGGTLQGWTSRLQRMRRAGSTLPVEKFPEVAAYLAAALPERVAPSQPPANAAKTRGK